MKKRVFNHYLLLCLAVFFLLFTSCSVFPDHVDNTHNPVTATPHDSGKSDNGNHSINHIPPYSGQPYIKIDGNHPKFNEKYKTRKSFEKYSKLDSLGRCGVAFANVGKNLMPTATRGSIGKIKPTGWHTVKYDNIEGKYLYNRCHLIGYQLTAENANERNLITGTHDVNVYGMLPFENLVADYVRDTGNHVLYRVKPIFEGNDLLAKGVQMEAYSVEDEGAGICFNVFVYNVQPGIQIDYETGNSKEGDGSEKNPDAKGTASPGANLNTGQNGGTREEGEAEIRGNKNTKIYHCPGQASYDRMADSDNLVIFHSEQEALDAGYRKAKR